MSLLSNRGITCLLAILCAMQSGGRTQGESVEKVLITSNRWPVHMTYYPSAKGPESPVVVFLHGDKEHRGFWEVDGKSWVPDLQKQGVACLTVDLRKHGQSQPPGVSNLKITVEDYQAMVTSDLAAVKKFIFKEHQSLKLNMRKMAIVGSGMSCTVALMYSAIDWNKKPWPDSSVLAARTPRGQDVRALILISPVSKVPGLPVGDAIEALKNPALDIALLTMAAVQDEEQSRTANLIYEKFKSSEFEQRPRVYKLEVAGDKQGIEMVLESKPARTAFNNFLKKYLLELPGEWADRKSPLDTNID